MERERKKDQRVVQPQRPHWRRTVHPQMQEVLKNALPLPLHNEAECPRIQSGWVTSWYYSFSRSRSYSWKSRPATNGQALSAARRMMWWESIMVDECDARRINQTIVLILARMTVEEQYWYSFLRFSTRSAIVRILHNISPSSSTSTNDSYDFGTNCTVLNFVCSSQSPAHDQPYFHSQVLLVWARHYLYDTTCVKLRRIAFSSKGHKNERCGCRFQESEHHIIRIVQTETTGVRGCRSAASGQAPEIRKTALSSIQSCVLLRRKAISERKEKNIYLPARG